MSAGIVAVDAGALHGRTLRFYDFAMAAFVVILICSNLIGAGKPAVVTLPVFGEVKFGAGILFFPLSYVLGDVLTEVYGFARARRCVWAGFAASLFAAGMSWVVVSLPPAADWTGQAALASVFGQVPRIFLASIAAFWAGEIANAVTLSRMKLWTGGRMLWTRTIGSTVVGQGVDSLIFYPARLPRRVGDEPRHPGAADQLCAEGAVGGDPDTRHLPHRRLVQGGGGDRRLRPGRWV